jgi:hypothetical protein
MPEKGGKQGIPTHLLKARGKPDRIACATCAEEAPLGTLVRAIDPKTEAL